MPLPPLRAGDSLLIKQRDLEFSFFPMTRTNRRWGLHSMLYAAEPWGVISGSVSEANLTALDKKSALSFVRQSREYFRAAEQAATIETRPLLYYYSFLNLGKAISILRGRPNLVGKVSHGIAAVHPRGYNPNTAEMAVSPSRTHPSAIDELHVALEGRAVATQPLLVREVFAQSVVGHRMWRSATAQPRKERFFAIDSVHWFHDPAAREIWARIYLRRDALSSRNRGVTETIREAALDGAFRVVADRDAEAAGLHTLEQLVGTPYSGRPADVVMDSVSTLRPLLWQTVTASPPYRRFYLYLSPTGEQRLPQWFSIYATFFWLGSLTRYQPVELLDLLEGPLGPFLQEFIETQPSQMLYLMASEAKRQDVAKPAVV